MFITIINKLKFSFFIFVILSTIISLPIIAKNNQLLQNVLSFCGIWKFVFFNLIIMFQFINWHNLASNYFSKTLNNDLTMNIKRQLIIPCTLIGLLILIPIYSVVVNYFKSASTLSLKSTLTELKLFSHLGKIVDIKDFNAKKIDNIVWF